MNKPFYGIDWCSDTIRRNLPGDDECWIEVRRFTRAEKLQRESIASTVMMSQGSQDGDSIPINYDISKVRAFEYEKAITDFKLRDKEGHFFRHSKPSKNREVYEHFNDALADFVDALIAEINKETETGPAEIEEVAKN